MGRTGFEPVTNWLKVNCSTNWANDPIFYLNFIYKYTIINLH